MHNPVRHSLIVSVALALPLFAASSACAQAPEWERENQPPFDGQRPAAGYTTRAALSEEWQSIHFYFVPNREVLLPNGRPSIEYVARRTSGREDEEAGTVTWATSRDCPSLHNTLVWMTALVAPRIELPGITPSEANPAGRRPVTMYTDGLSTTVWGRGTQPDHTLGTRVEISSNGGLIAEFGKAANDNLVDCWKNEEPKF